MSREARFGTVEGILCDTHTDLSSFSVAARLRFAGAACGRRPARAVADLLYTLDPGETILNDDPLTLALNPTEVVLITTKERQAGTVLRPPDGRGKVLHLHDRRPSRSISGRKIPEQRKPLRGLFAGAPRPARSRRDPGERRPTLRYKARHCPHMSCSLTR